MKTRREVQELADALEAATVDLYGEAYPFRPEDPDLVTWAARVQSSTGRVVTEMSYNGGVGPFVRELRCQLGAWERGEGGWPTRESVEAAIDGKP